MVFIFAFMLPPHVKANFLLDFKKRERDLEVRCFLRLVAFGFARMLGRSGRSQNRMSALAQRGLSLLLSLGIACEPSSTCLRFGLDLVDRQTMNMDCLV